MDKVFAMILDPNEDARVHKVFTSKEKYDAYTKVFEKVEDDVGCEEIEVDPEPPKLYRYAVTGGDILTPLYEGALGDCATNIKKPMSDFFELAKPNPIIHIRYSLHEREYECFSDNIFSYHFVIPGMEDETEKDLKRRCLDHVKENVIQFKYNVLSINDIQESIFLEKSSGLTEEEENIMSIMLYHRLQAFSLKRYSNKIMVKMKYDKPDLPQLESIRSKLKNNITLEMLHFSANTITDSIEYSDLIGAILKDLVILPEYVEIEFSPVSFINSSRIKDRAKEIYMANKV